MKKIIIALMLLLPLTAFAQATSKIGYINKNELAQTMPEYDAALKQLEDMQLKYQMEGQKLQGEAQKKLQEFTEAADTLDPAIRKYKENELMRLEQSIQEFSKSAQENIQKKQQELMAPIIAKMEAAIKKVGTAKGFTYIIDNSMGALAFVSPNAENVMQLVKTELGIK